MTKVSFNNKSNAFYATLKSSVEQYFSAHQIRKTGNWKLYAKTGILIPGAILIYISLLLFHLPAPVNILLCALLGLVLASIGFNVMHDACHGSYSSRSWVNDLM